MLYRILVTSIIGMKNSIVELPDNQQTKQRLAKGLIEPVEQYQPTERKTMKGKRGRKAE